MSNRPRPTPRSAVARSAAEQRRRQAAGPSAPTGRGRVPFVVGGVLAAVVLLALLVAVRVTATDTTAGQARPSGTVVRGEHVYGDVRVSGQALPAPPEDPTAVDPAVGQAAPVLTGEDFAGREVRIGGDGQPTLVLFVAHWCPHCQKEVPLLQAEFDTHGKPPGVRLVTVSTSATADRPNFPPAAWLVREGWTVETLADTQAGKAANAFGIGGFPFFVAIDRSGTVVARRSGELPISEFLGLADRARAGSTAGTTGSPSPPGTTAGTAVPPGR